MNYYKEISKSFIKVWEDFYINYLALFGILDPVYKKYKEQKKKRIEKQYISLNFSKNIDSEPLLDSPSNDKDKSELKLAKKVSEKFKEQFLAELKKVEFFYDQNLTKSIFPKIKELKEQINHSIKINEFRVHKETFEMAIKEAYKDIHLIYKFVETNFEIKDKLLKKYRKYLGIYSRDKKKDPKDKNNEIIMEDEQENDENEENIEEVESSIKNFITFQSKIGNAKEILDSLKEEVTQLFVQNFSSKYSSKSEKELKKCVQNNNFTESQSFYLGFFIGLLIFELSIICIIAWYYDIDMDNDPDFKSVFPMFRGFFIVCLYWWMHGVNILVWTKADISYKIIFQVDNDASSPIEIFKRAAFFTFILLTSVLIYMIKRIWTGVFFGILDPIPIHRIPLICWVSLLLVIFMPFRIWNYSGRAWLGKLAKESFTSFLFKTGFRHVYFMSQLCSFIAPMRDIEYTICYYAYYDAPLWAKKEYCKKTRGIYFFIAFFPNFIKILQSIREIKESKKLFPKIYSIMNCCLSITVALLSFLWPQYPSLRILWVIFTFISSCSSFTWDILIDFGFFEKGKNYPLRNKLYYRPKIIYYFICIYDFILRFFWLLTISPEVLGTLFRPETLSIILNSFEITRRGCWNIIKIENKHIDISKEFKVSNDVELPYIKFNGKYVRNETNLLSIMKMDRQHKIQVEIEKILQDNKSDNKILYMSRNLTDLREVKGKMNNELNEYIEAYKTETDINIGNIGTNYKSLNQPTRRWA